ncbi:MAG TPA: Asp-tRNA(Asn)/Glu-tRNA(Gln) amidotransferase subunit GatC [Ectothiorhodospiraceae bacterium]|nr:Asp-tRNA(Asn)/Glu-tRNA(Gln) amidotransferase subunit GatC [Ectothiorhodospiraceae bacterium]
MALDKKDVEGIAHLARLAIDEADIDGYAESLSNILGLVDQLNSVDTEGVTPMAHPMHMVQRLRADEVTETNQREHLQEHAPAVERGLFLVPKVIE